MSGDGGGDLIRTRAPGPRAHGDLPDAGSLSETCLDRLKRRSGELLLVERCRSVRLSGHQPLDLLDWAAWNPGNNGNSGLTAAALANPADGGGRDIEPVCRLVGAVGAG